MIVGPLQPLANAQLEYDLCHRLQTLTLDGRWRNGFQVEDDSDIRSTPAPVGAGTSDTHMLDGPSCQLQQSVDSECSSTPSTSVVRYGCAYLQAVQAQLEWFPTTGGEYLEAIFTHREVFRAHPPGHRSCARGFSDIAKTLERRPGRPDRDSDAEAAAAFRHEAWVIASSL